LSGENESLSNLNTISKKSIKDIATVNVKNSITDRRAESVHISKRTQNAKLKAQ